MKNKAQIWLVVLGYIAVVLPFVYLVIAFFSHNLSVNPVLTAEQYSGDYAIAILVASLACTPLYQVSSFSGFLRLRPVLGLAAFFYAFFHFLLFIWPDYGFDFPQILLTISRKPYIIIGLAVLVILIILAITSIRKIRIAMAKNWKIVQRLVYFAAAGAVLHYGLAVKGNLFTLRGNILIPYIYAGITAFLLILRIPLIQRFITIHRVGKAPKKDTTDLV